jgi:hypothetical protein
MTISNQTYNMETPPVPAMTWDDYELLVRKEFEALLLSDADEKKMQSFLETHPCMVPGAFDLAGGLQSGHYPFPTALISQPILPSYTYRKPDFMWLAKNSMEFTPVMIEIESPSKKWFKKKGISTAELTEAIHQLKDWKVWLENPYNKLAFYDYYEIPSRLRKLRFRPRFLLIYGRRLEATADAGFANIRSQLQAHDEVFMTYDRLGPENKLRNLLCVKINKEGYYAISVPPTLKLGPSNADEWLMINRKQDAVRNSKLIPEPRKDFLVRRFDYWDDWASKGNFGVINTGDVE